MIENRKAFPQPTRDNAHTLAWIARNPISHPSDPSAKLVAGMEEFLKGNP